MVRCGARGGLSTLVYVRAMVCKNCVVPKLCWANAVVRRTRAPHKSGPGREERLLQHVHDAVRFVNTALRRGCVASTLDCVELCGVRVNTGMCKICGPRAARAL